MNVPNKTYSIFLFTGNTMLKGGELVYDIYTRRRDQDGFLYLVYDRENAFGLTP